MNAVTTKHMPEASFKRDNSSGGQSVHSLRRCPHPHVGCFSAHHTVIFAVHPSFSSFSRHLSHSLSLASREAIPHPTQNTSSLLLIGEAGSLSICTSILTVAFVAAETGELFGLRGLRSCQCVCGQMVKCVRAEIVLQ